VFQIEFIRPLALAFSESTGLHQWQIEVGVVPVSLFPEDFDGR
jgi:hypothetical protein